MTKEQFESLREHISHLVVPILHQYQLESNDYLVGYNDGWEDARLIYDTQRRRKTARN